MREVVSSPTGGFYFSRNKSQELH